MIDEAESKGMSASDYEMLRQELDEIILTSERFPKGVRELIRQSLVQALLNEGGQEFTASAAEQQMFARESRPDAEDTSIIDHESASAFSLYLTRYTGIKLNDMEFCAVVARFFTREISEELRLDSIDSKLLMEAVRIADRRKPPANPATTLNNAKNVGEYLEPRGKGVYGVSGDGIRHLDKRLKDKSRWTAQSP